MEFPIEYRGERAGSVTVLTDMRGTQFSAACQLHNAAILRLYGLTDSAPLLIGVLAPDNGMLTLKRRISAQTMRDAGCSAQQPDRYYLDDGTPGCRPIQAEKKADTGTQTGIAEAESHVERINDAQEESQEKTWKAPCVTGDPLLDHVLQKEGVVCVQGGDGMRLFCPFDHRRANPLAFALTACTVEHTEQGPKACLWLKDK